MRKYGAFEVARDVYQVHERTAKDGVRIDGGAPRHGFRSPSKKLEWWSRTLHEWGWEDEAIPTYLRTHVYWRDMDLEGDERILLPIFRLPTLIHTRSGNAKYLYEISHGHPLWMNPRDADALGFTTGDLVRLNTDSGYFVMRVWRTEGIRPGVVAASHHLGRWRLSDALGNDRWSSALVEIDKMGDTTWRLRQKKGIEPFTSEDPDSERVWWRDAGVNQNLAFPPHPDPVSGMHAWHQRVRIVAAEAGDRYGDLVVDTAKSFQVYREWLQMAKPAPGPGGLRRPLWLDRPVRPIDDAYYLP
jgi:anaerobic selenocysteine-containing dehydrogenase